MIDPDILKRAVVDLLNVGLIGDMTQSDKRRMNKATTSLEIAITAASAGSASSAASVKAFGAIGDGVHDDTDAIQQVLDTNDQIYFPPGTYRITAPLTLQDRIGVHIFGHQWHSQIYTDQPLDAMLYMDGVAVSTIESICFLCGGAVNKAIDHVFTNYPPVEGKTRWSAQAVTFRNVDVTVDAVGSWVWAFAIGTNENYYANDGNSFYDCHTYGRWEAGNTETYQAGWRFGDTLDHGGNNLNHFMYGCSSLRARYHVDANRVNIMAYGGEPLLGETCFHLYAWQNSVISGINTEGYQRFITYLDQSTTVQGLSVSDIIFRGDRIADDGYWIDINTNGIHEFNSCQAMMIRDGVTAKVRLNTRAGLLVTLKGLAQPTPYEDGIDNTNPDFVTIHSSSTYVETDHYTQVVEIVPYPRILGTEMVPDSDMDDPLSNWSVGALDNAILRRADDGAPGGGDHSLEIEVKEGNDFGDAVITFPTEPGVTYRFNFYYEHLSTDYINAVIYDALAPGDPPIKYLFFWHSADHEWLRGGFYFVAPSVSTMLNIQARPTAGFVGIGRVDRVSCRKVLPA